MEKYFPFIGIQKSLLKFMAPARHSLHRPKVRKVNKFYPFKTPP